ncbi:hypothetical protein Vadar_009281 [Vaccinium darrowii]|uniref:Uncharacterized protein n=1 Tax=Vaccinium darrowii TaxID=229202 RepID=A0ACB7ZBH6_9ERIC|nr:hypothetical protein Vadar_009281 [Vaccinium darrowii]
MDNVRDLLSSHELDKISPLSAPDLRLLIDRLQIHSLHIKSKVHDYILSDHPINVEIREAVANGVTYWCGCIDASRYPHDSIQPTASHFNSEAQNAPEMNPYTSLHHPNSPSSMAAETFCCCQWKTEKSRFWQRSELHQHLKPAHCCNFAIGKNLRSSSDVFVEGVVIEDLGTGREMVKVVWWVVLLVVTRVV